MPVQRQQPDEELRPGAFVSKRQAALWAWREDWYRPDVDHQATLAATVRFVNFALDEILDGRSSAET